MSVTFSKDTTTVTLPGPVPGYVVALRRRQAIGRTTGGTAYVYDKGLTVYELQFDFESLTDAEKSALAAFHRDEAMGARSTFTFTDDYGTARTARFAEAGLSFTKVAHNVWDARVALELDSLGD